VGGELVLAASLPVERAAGLQDSCKHKRN
jgi:hypothetical protein